MHSFFKIVAAVLYSAANMCLVDFCVPRFFWFSKSLCAFIGGDGTLHLHALKHLGPSSNYCCYFREPRTSLENGILAFLFDRHTCVNMSIAMYLSCFTIEVDFDDC